MSKLTYFFIIKSIGSFVMHHCRYACCLCTPAVCNKKYYTLLKLSKFLSSQWRLGFFVFIFRSLLEYNDNTFSILYFISNHSLAKHRRKD